MDCNTNQPTAISSKIARRALRDIEFICKQLIRFARMTANELRAYMRSHPNDIFCHIPRPDGNGSFQCGILGWNKLEGLANLTLDLDHGLRRRVGRQRALNAVTKAFAQRMLEESCELNEGTAVLVLQDALGSLRQSLVVTEHYLPCVLFPDGNPDAFSVGPVTFTRRGLFFQDKKQVLKRSVEINTADHIEYVNRTVARGFPRERALTKDGSREIIRGLYARAKKTYREYPWIASVKVTDCDKDTSQKRSAQAVEMALHVIRVLLGARATRQIRLAWTKSGTFRTAHMHTDACGVIQVTAGIKYLWSADTNNWHAILTTDTSALKVLGSALTSIVDPVEIRHLNQRLIDAVNWFGDAATDLNPTSSIVKYVSAIERLLFGKFESGHTRLFANRVQCVLRAFGGDHDKKAHEHATAVYKTRSALLHGMYSPTEDSAHELVHRAESLSRMCLLCATQLYPMMLQAFGDPDPAKLEDVMNRINCEGVGWLVAAAGYRAVD